MKKLVGAIFLLCFLLCTSCTSKVEKDILSFNNGNVKKISVKEIQIDSSFFMYIPDYLEATDQYEECYKVIDECLGDLRRITSSLFSYSDDDFKRGDALIAKMDSLQKIAPMYAEKADSISKLYTSGILYVAKYLQKDKYGNWPETNQYGVYLYDNKGQIQEYNGSERFDIISSAYPDVANDVLKNIGDIFKEATK